MLSGDVCRERVGGEGKTARGETKFLSETLLSPWLYLSRVCVGAVPSKTHHARDMAASNLQLHASAHLIGQECKESNYSFLLCKKQSMDPAACLTEGASVKKCVDNL